MKNEPMSGNASLPSIVISLDLELRWGMHDKLGLNLDAYRENLEGVRYVVPELLKLLLARNIRATWASVGALGCRDWTEYLNRAPKPPKYHNSSLAISPRYAELDPEGYLHFAPELLQAVYRTPGQELGTHTFSHIYMREPGVTAEDFRADLSAVSLLWRERFGTPPKSLVFPKNQYAFLSVVRASSARVWRGNETPWYYNCNEASTNLLFPRACRLLDSLNPFVRRASPLAGDSALFMTRASLFLRTNLPRAAWALHVSRIRTELNALRSGEIFHIWFHPHNLGKDTNVRLARVEEVIDVIAEKCTCNLLASRSMADLAP